MGDIRKLSVLVIVCTLWTFTCGQESQKFKVKLNLIKSKDSKDAKVPVVSRRYHDPHYNPRTCAEADYCCHGANNTCYALGRRLDGNANETRCYCDSNCLVMADCCLDYHEFCQSIDCKVSDWSDWGECDNPCGLGTRRRKRKVSKYSENGGKKCPALKQRRVCVGSAHEEDCLQQSVTHTEELKETGRILPAAYGIFRTSSKYDPWKGILKNLYGRNFNEILSRATYCGTFLVTKSRAACNSSLPGHKWSKSLNKGAKICVECQPTAMDRDRGLRCIGHGVSEKLTRWSAINVPHCHGEWLLLGQHKPCTCDQDLDPDDDPEERDGPTKNFIFI